MPTLSTFFSHSGVRVASSVLWLLVIAGLIACGLESDGSRKTPPTVAESVSQPEPKSEPRLGAQTSVPGGAAAKPTNRKKRLELLVEVLTQPGYETELRVWTAGHMAGLYPLESAEMLGTTLKAADPKVVIAVIDALTLDTSDQIRAAVESLESHSDSQVAKAARKKLNNSN